MVKPILFNTEMVKAILEGRKTSTRRIVKENVLEKFVNLNWDPNENTHLAPYWVGDILYVRETWNFLPCMKCDATGCCNGVPIKFKGQSGCFSYKINSNVDTEKWKPSIHMPKFAARIFLKVTDIKVQMLQDITEDEAQQEGIDPEVAIEYSNWRPTFYDPDSGGEPNYREAFKDLWDGIYKKKGYEWEGNPWVFVISFKRVEKEE